MFGLFKILDPRAKRHGDLFYKVYQITGCRPHKVDLYRLALTHSSATYEQKGIKYNNERLEFLGDAILGAVVADYLYQKYPDREEGYLTSLRSSIVKRKQLNLVAKQLNLHEMVITRNVKVNEARFINGDVLEAFIGALYLDCGMKAVKKFVVNKIIRSHVDFNKIENCITSYKSEIIEWSQKNKENLRFKTTGVWGQDHNRKFEVSMLLNEKIISTGKGSNKKKAEEEAAYKGYRELMDYGQTKT